MTADWQKAERFSGDESYLSPIFMYGGGAEIFLNPDDGEGAALTLRIASDIRASAAIDLTIAEARSLAEWLTLAAQEMEDEL